MDAGHGHNKYGISPFKGDDFPDWSFRVKLVLEEQALWNVVSVAPALVIPADFVTNDLKARRIIVECIDNSVLEYVKDKVSAYGMWQGLKTIYDSSSYTKRVIAFKKLIRLEYNLSESLQTFFRNFDVVTRGYKSAGGTLADTELIVIMLSCLPDDFSSVVTAISTLSEDQFTAEKVRRYLLEEESRIKDRSSLAPHGSGSELTAAFYNNENVRCFNCDQLGHKADICKEPRKKSNKNNYGQRKFNKKGKNSKGPGGSKYALMNRLVESKNDKPNVVRFICDTGCSEHLVNNVSILRDVKTVGGKFIELAKNGECLELNQVGTLFVKITNGREKDELSFSNVNYCKDARENLLSIGALDKKGVVFQVKDGTMTASLGGVKLFVAKKLGSLYYVDFEVDSSKVNVASSDKSRNTLWHKRLGHISMQSICKMAKSRMVNGISSNLTSDIDFCDCCAKAKITRVKFDGKRPETTRPLERVHSDVCGPFTPTFDGYQYYVVFIDDFTHVTVTYLMKRKSEVLSKFQEYCEAVESHFGLKLSRLRCDNGGEYTGTAFKNFCVKKGIVIEYTVPYNPQQNGVSERMNRTICDKMRSLLHDSHLTDEFWGEAVLTATYLTNRSSTVSLKSKTPFEMWYQRKPDLSNLKVFGCKAIAHIPKEKRKGKLELPGGEYIFVGYGINGYRLFDDNRKMIVLAKSVQFNESTSAVTTVEVSSQSKGDTVANVQDLSPNTQLVTQVEVNGGTQFQSPRVTSTPRSSSVVVTGTPIVNTPVMNTPVVVTPGNSSTIITTTPVRRQTPVNQTDDSPEVFSTPVASTPVVSRYPRRHRVKPFWMRTGEFDSSANYAYLTNYNEVPEKYDDVAHSDEQAEWRNAIDDEVHSLMKNETWDIVDYPKGAKLIDSRWIFKRKHHGISFIYKARLVAKGYMQKEGIDFAETYAPVARLQTIRVLLALGNVHGLLIDHLDVKTAFLHGDLNEDVYMKAPQGIDVPKDKVLKLRKSLYGLKQAPRCWNLKFHEVMLKLGFNRSDTEPCLYIKSTTDCVSIIVVYVDDMLFLGSNRQEMDLIKRQMCEEFELKDLGAVENFMGLKVERDIDKGVMTISQESYAEEILNRFDMTDCKPRNLPIEVKLDLDYGDGTNKTSEPYRELLGSLMYLMLGTRPDISYAVNKMSRYQENATDEHWSYLKGILRYIKGTTDYKLVYRRASDVPLRGYADSDWANDKIDRKSTSGYLFEVYGNVVVWCSKKQPIVTLSTTEAEYVAACTAVQESIWIEKLLTDLDIEVKYPIQVFEDNFGCCMVSKNPETKRTKHIDVRYHYLRNLVLEGRYVLDQISTEDQVADIFTKGLPKKTFEKFVEKMSLKCGEVLSNR